MKRRRFLTTTTPDFVAPRVDVRAEIPFFEPSGVQDFDELWRTLAERYGYFGQKATDWPQVRAVYRPQAAQASTMAELNSIIRRTLNELYDGHSWVD